MVSTVQSAHWRCNVDDCMSVIAMPPIAVEAASKTLEDLRIAEVVKQNVTIEKGKVTGYPRPPYHLLQVSSVEKVGSRPLQLRPEGDDRAFGDDSDPVTYPAEVPFEVPCIGPRTDDDVLADPDVLVDDGALDHGAPPHAVQIMWNGVSAPIASVPLHLH